jgi:hypothetical protein
VIRPHLGTARQPFAVFAMSAVIRPHLGTARQPFAVFAMSAVIRPHLGTARQPFAVICHVGASRLPNPLFRRLQPSAVFETAARKLQLNIQNSNRETARNPTAKRLELQPGNG